MGQSDPWVTWGQKGHKKTSEIFFVCLSYRQVQNTINFLSDVSFRIGFLRETEKENLKLSWSCKSFK